MQLMPREAESVTTATNFRSFFCSKSERTQLLRGRELALPEPGGSISLDRRLTREEGKFLVRARESFE
jgi:hypothetical protein